MKKKRLKILLLNISISLLFVTNFGYSQTDTILLKEVQIKEIGLQLNCVNKKTIDSLSVMHNVNKTAADVLKFEPGLSSKNYGNGSLSTIAIRGTDASHTKVNWNDIPINSTMNGMVDFSLIPVTQTQNIFLLYGANSTANVGGAFGGLISIETDTSFNRQKKIEINEEVGSFGLNNSLLSIKLGKRKFSNTSVICYNKSNNNFIYINNGIYPKTEMVQKNAEYNRLNIFEDVRYLLKNNLLEIHYWQTFANRNLPQIMTNVLSAKHVETQEDKSSKLSAKWTYNNRKFIFSFNQAYYFGFLNYNLEQYSGNNLVSEIKSTSTEKSLYSIVNSAFIISEFCKINASLIYNFSNAKYYEKKMNYNFIVNQNSIEQMGSFEYNNNKKISFDILARIVKHQNFEPTVIPAIFFKYNFNKTLTLKSSFSRNTNFPDLNSLYFIPGGNINLRPEKAYQSEININFKNKLNETLFEVFYNDVNNWILWQPTQFGYWKANNVRSVISKGIQFKTTINIKVKRTNLYLINSYTYNLAKANDNEYICEQLPYLPKHSANSTLNIAFLNTNLSINEQYISSRYTSPYNNYNILEPIFMTDVIISYNLYFNNLKIKFDFKANNIFDKSYQYVVWRAMPGRNYSIGLSIKL